MKDNTSALIRRLWFPGLLFVLPLVFVAVAWDYPTYFPDGYHLTTKHLAEKGIYSRDGVNPYVGKQPPGFPILSVPFHYVVGFPRAAKVSGAFWTGLAAILFYLLLGEMGLGDLRRPFSLLFLLNPETLSSGAQWGISESGALFTLVAGAYSLARHHRDTRPNSYLLAALAFGFAPLVRFPCVAFTAAFLGYSVVRARRLRLLILPAVLLAALPSVYWMTRPPVTSPAPVQGAIALPPPRPAATVPPPAANAGKIPLLGLIPKSMEKYYRDIAYFRRPPGQRLGMLGRVLILILLTEAARIYLLALPWVYVGVGRVVARWRDPGPPLLRFILLGWGLYLGVHIAYANVIPRYLLPVLPFSLLFAAYGGAPLFRRRWGWSGLAVAVAIHGAVSLPFALGPADDAWAALGGTRVTRRAKNLDARADVIRWVNEHLPPQATLLDPKPGSEAAYREDLRIARWEDLGRLPEPLFFVNYSLDFIYLHRRLDREALERGEVVETTWAYGRDDEGTLLTRNREVTQRGQSMPVGSLKGRIVATLGGKEIQIVRIERR